MEQPNQQQPVTPPTMAPAPDPLLGTSPAPVAPQPQPPKKKNRILLIVVILLALAALVTSIMILMNPRGLETDATEASGEVSINSRGVTPPSIKIKKGDSVTWTNQDSAAHALVLTSPNLPAELEGFGGEPMSAGESYSFTFEATGTFTYQDPENPEKVKGTIVVE